MLSTYISKCRGNHVGATTDITATDAGAHADADADADGTTTNTSANTTADATANATAADAKNTVSSRI
jgi:hypothetical protein